MILMFYAQAFSENEKEQCRKTALLKRN